MGLVAFFPLLLVVVVATLFSIHIFSRYHTRLIFPALQSPSSSSPSLPAVCFPANETFLYWAQKFDTDKVSTHHYDLLYEELLAPYRCRPTKVLEIGLGCDMVYGAGHSLYVWLNYFTQLDLHFLEYNGACVEKHRASMKPATIHIGDQANVADLSRVGDGFDIIIDDGGHRWSQQLTSLDFLIHHALKPGGIYVIEDLLTSGDAAYADYPINVAERLARIQHQMMLEYHHATPPLQFTEEDKALLKVVKWISCATGICVLKTYDETDGRLNRRWPRD